VSFTLGLVGDSERADWITLDGGGILLVLVAWALAAGFACGGVAFVAAASFPQPQAGRARRAQQAAVCFALALLSGFGLPAVFETMGHEAGDALANWALLWAPALAAVCGLLVRQVGRARL
jgi:cytochrome bd-type quinol oxidase subunit 2